MGKLLKMLTEAGWEAAVKESGLTKPLNSLTSILSEATQAGEQTTVDYARSWSDGISALKTFLAKHREFQKSCGKHNKMLPVIQHLLDTRKFLREQGLAPHPTLGLLVVRAAFFEKFEDNAEYEGTVLKDGCGALKEHEVLSLWKPSGSASDDAEVLIGASNVMSWLRGLLFRGFESILDQYFQSLTPQDVSSVRMLLRDLMDV